MEFWPVILMVGLKLVNLNWYSKYSETKYFLEPPSSHDIQDMINSTKKESAEIVNVKPDFKPEFKPYPMNYRFFC